MNRHGFPLNSMTGFNSDRAVGHSDSQIESCETIRPGQVTLAQMPEMSNRDDKSHRPDIQHPIQNPIDERKERPNYWQGLLNGISWVPPRCRWNAENPSKFGLPLNILFAFSGAFTVCNMQYCCKTRLKDWYHYL